MLFFLKLNLRYAYLAKGAVVSDLALLSGLRFERLSMAVREIGHHFAEGQRANEDALEDVEHLLVREADVLGQLPGQML